jgi:hypothetical protein
MAKPMARIAPQAAEIARLIHAATEESFDAQVALDVLAEEEKALLRDGSDEALDAHERKTRAARRRLGRAEEHLAKLRDDLKVAEEAESAARRKSETYALRAFCASVDDEYPEAREKMLWLVAFQERNAKAWEDAGKFNNALHPGEKPIDLPGRSFRYSPAPTLANFPMRVFGKLKKGMENSTISGDARYDSEMREERPPFGGEPAFTPRPLHHTFEIPSMCKGDPSYRIPPHLKW